MTILKRETYLGLGAVASLGALMDNGGRRIRRRAKMKSGDTAWMITSSALVLMMTIPGLGLFYGGMVRGRSCWRHWRKASAPPA